MTISAKSRKIIALRREYIELKGICKDLDEMYTKTKDAKTGVIWVSANKPCQRFLQLRALFYPEFKYNGWENPMKPKKGETK